MHHYLTEISMIPQDVLELTQFVSNLLLIGLVPALLFAYYKFLPMVGAKLTSGFLDGLFTKSTMTELSQKGVEARQVKALQAQENQLVLGAIMTTDPLKALASPLIEAFATGFIDSIDGIPRETKLALKAQMASRLPIVLANSRVNFTNWAVQGLDSKFPKLKVKENLNALGVITNATPIEQTTS